MTDDPTGSTRRALLRAGAATVASVASMGTAGCFATLPPLGGRVDFGPVDPPAAGDPTYRDWIPAESAFADLPDDDGRQVLPTVSYPPLKRWLVGGFPFYQDLFRLLVRTLQVVGLVFFTYSPWLSSRSRSTG